MEENEASQDYDNEEQLEVLPSRIVNPPNHIFRKKSVTIRSLPFFEIRRSYTIQTLNKLEKKEEIAKVSPIFTKPQLFSGSLRNLPD